MSRSGLNQADRKELNEIAHNFTTTSTKLRYACIDRPGEYSILKLTAVTSEFVLRLGFNPESIENDIILKLVEGDVVNVVEVKVDHQSNRIRARITDPVPGWISLRKNLNGSRWAFRTERHQLQDRMAVGEFYAWKEYKLKDANTKKHELESRLRIVAKLHFNEMTHLSVTDIGNEQVVIAVTYIDKIVADFEAACISVAREGAARHASCYDLPYYGIFHDDILEAVRCILGESYPEVCVETKSWGANIGRSTCRGHRLVFTMNLRFNGFCTLRCDNCYGLSYIPLRDKPSFDASLLNADLDMHTGNSIDASWSWRHPTWLRVHDQSIQNRESRGWVYGIDFDSCSFDSWRFTRDYCTDSSSDANFSIVVSNNFGNAMKEKVEYAKIRMIELLDNMPAHEYFVAHVFDGLCPDELTLVEIDQQMQTMIGVHAEFNGISVNIDREDLNYFECCLDERKEFDECSGLLYHREPPEQNISFKRLSLWMSAFFHEKIVEQFVEECETKKILGLTTYSRTYDVPFGDHYIGGGCGSNRPIPNEDFTFPDYEKRNMDEGKFKGLALSQRRAEDAMKGLRKLFDKIGLKAVDVETKRSLRREVKKLKHGFCESHYAKWQLEVKSNLPLSGRDEPPNELLCPITCDVMIDPVVAADGHTYERKAIEEWFSHFQQGKSPRSPKTNETIETRLLFPNHAIRSQCSGHT